MVTTVLAASSLALLEACERDGLDRDALLAAAGLAPEDLAAPGARLPLAAATALWRLAQERARDPAIGLRAVDAARFGAYRVIDYLTASAATAGGALGHLARSFPLITSALALSISRRAEGVWLRLAPAAPLLPIYAEYTLAAIYRRVRAATGGRLALERVQLAVPAAPARRELERAFDCELELGAAAPGLLLSHRAWDEPNPGRDEALERALADHAARLVADLGAPADLVRIRAALREELARGAPSLRALARRLATSPRSLQRTLARHRLGYARLLEETRIAAALDYLRDPRRSLSEIAELVGFSHPSSFARAFRSATGRSPSEHRRALAARARGGVAQCR